MRDARKKRKNHRKKANKPKNTQSLIKSKENGQNKQQPKNG